jgi:hypothetical protein
MSSRPIIGDVDAMADAIYSICTYPAMAEHLKIEGKIEVDILNGKMPD